MAHPRTRARWLLGLLGLLVVVACVVLFIPGCTAGGNGGWFGGLFGGGASSSGGGDSGGGAGGGLPSLWGAGSLARLDWWIGLAGGACIVAGVFRILRTPPDLGGAVLAVGCGVALFAVNAVVAVLFPALVWIAILATAVLGGVWIFTLATGRGTGFRSLRKRVAGVLDRLHAHKTDPSGQDFGWAHSHSANRHKPKGSPPDMRQ